MIAPNTTWPSASFAFVVLVRMALLNYRARPPPDAHGLLRPVRSQKDAHLVDRLLEQVLRLSPREDRRLGLRRERGNIHGRLIGVRRRVVRHHEHWRWAGPDELARHAVHEVRAHAIEVVEIAL